MVLEGLLLVAGKLLHWNKMDQLQQQLDVMSRLSAGLLNFPRAG
jgi:hypothetical protein